MVMGPLILALIAVSVQRIVSAPQLPPHLTVDNHPTKSVKGALQGHGRPTRDTISVLCMSVVRSPWSVHSHMLHLEAGAGQQGMTTPLMYRLD